MKYFMSKKVYQQCAEVTFECAVNTFLEESPDLIVLDSRNIANAAL